MNAQLKPTDNLAELLAQREKLQAAAAALDARRAKLEPFKQALEKAQAADAELVASDARRMREWIDAGGNPPAPRPQDRSKTLAAVDSASAQYAAAQSADRDLQQDGAALAVQVSELQKQIAMVHSSRLLDAHAEVLRSARAALLKEVENDRLAGLLKGAANRADAAALTRAGRDYAAIIGKPLSRGEMAEAERRAHVRFAEIADQIGL